ncbi:MAG: uroporphyrinogen-III C-methyltransferase, partial [Candidatus Dormibacteraceae bacterium]
MLTLIGIGPGHPRLLTLQAAAAIGVAEVIRHPEGCDPAILDHAPAGADLARYQGPTEVLELAQGGSRVAVLFAGDPYAFSEGAGLAELLERAGIDFEVIPGLLLETAAPALSGIPLTLEGRSASIALGTPGQADTAVLRLADGWWESGVAALQRHGWSDEAPAALLLGAGQAGQKRVVATLTSVTEMAQREGVSGDALLVVGPGVELAERLDTLSRRPLHGVRILVTRPRQQASG